ncbi:hypothetical protein BHF71_00125 [Vulcanibacillus modesticaldus]|uniref:tRNA(Met) cytidine acetate ligase n=1 Tax=Vulcanibacillus modesticaldus TaxID=337097 RepID=A0A1D2YXC2_9BACI|nr:nucleotidyltransferase [Vulcanibacillus modesticaldus]OEG00352.1 hypothetical protein BHF71_00125 [Vulcanibacillus modesticaldus]
MSTLGIIVEYNPFHNGHLFHFQQAKKITKADTTIAVMSGSFLQRGEPAIIDKWTRTKMALAQGVDLVIELPTIYATQSADWFAYGATFLLDQLNVDHLVFGSERNSLDLLNDVSDLLLNETTRFKKHLKETLSLGHSYPKALALSINHFLGKEDIEITQPNDILGIQYILNLKKMNSSVKVHTIKREYAGYHDPNISSHPIASATAIRKSIFTNNSLKDILSVVPNSTYQLLIQEFKQNRFNSWDNFFTTLQIMATGKDKLELSNIHGMLEGLENRIKQQLLAASSFSELMNLLTTKRYTKTKIQRTLLYLLLNLTKDKVRSLNVKKGPQYIRVLGFNDVGRAFLRRKKHDLNLPLITNIPRDKPLMLEIDINASKIYEAGFKNPSMIIDEYKQAPIYWK